MFNDINKKQKLYVILRDYIENETSKGDTKNNPECYVKDLVHLLVGEITMYNDRIETYMGAGNIEMALYELGHLNRAIKEISTEFDLENMFYFNDLVNKENDYYE